MEEKKCPRCGSNQIKKAKEKDDFLSYKGEGDPAKRYIPKSQQKWFCWKCNHEWVEDLNLNSGGPKE